MTITENGRHFLTNNGKPVFLSGLIGGATVKIIYVNERGDEVDLADGAVASIPHQYYTSNGDMAIYLKVSGASSTNITAEHG